MKKLLIVIAVAMGVGVAPAVKADVIIPVVSFAVGLFAGTHKNDEPHWSFRDGCTVASVHVPAAGGGYNYASYDHCKTLPRVYGGSEWKPVLTGGATSPSA